MANLGFALRLGEDDKDRRGENLAKQDGKQLTSVYNLQSEVARVTQENKELKNELKDMKAELEAIKKLLKK